MRKSGSISVLFVIAIMVMLLVPGAVGADSGMVLTGTETQITTDLGDQYDNAIDGSLVVFTDYRSSDTDVYYVDLTTMVEHPVIVAWGNQELTGVSDGLIVYTDYRTSDVVVFNTADATTQNITAADKESLGHPFNSVDPAVSHGLVAWEDSRDGNMEIYAKYLATGEERRITDDAAVDSWPSVSGSIIVWQRCAAGGTCDIWSYDWATGVTTQITDTPASNERDPNIEGQKIVYQGDRDGDNDIYLHDLATSTEKRLTLPGDQYRPHVSGEFVSMDDLSAGLYHIKLWHYPSDATFQITSGTSGQYLNDIDGNRVVYTDDRNGDLEIYMYEFQTTIPVILSCDSAGNAQEQFAVGESVYVKGTGLNPNTTYRIWIQDDPVAEGDALLAGEDLSGYQEPVTTDDKGDFGPIDIWAIPSDAPISYNQYDIVVDRQDGDNIGNYSSASDGIDTMAVIGATAPVPEPATWVLLGVGLLTLGGVVLLYRKRKTATA
jgi:beta propeller repeat protein